MPVPGKIYIWKKIPFIRLIVPLIAGILIQFQFSFSADFLLAFAGLIVLISLVFYLLTFSARYRYRWLSGFAVNVSLFIIGALLIVKQDIANKKNWIGNYQSVRIAVFATIEEPLIEKAKTIKAEASVEAVNIDGQWKEATGRILMYFNKESSQQLKYGSQVLFYKPLQLIKNSGNPGGFDYKQYNLFQGIYHQVFLKPNEYKITNSTKENRFKNWLFTIRSWVIQTLQQYIEGDREAGVAEALLIGYRNDLDKDLVQAYRNTGVVHIIAISGLHLGMIYLALVWLLRPFKRTKWIRWIKPLMILTVLWVFTLLAGAVPSILRSAVMFSFIVVGETINRKSSIYNTLASSAFVLLCINPYYLWDIGFQLSYAAVLSIITFQKSFYNWFYFKNKLLDFFWRLASVTLAAQVLTIPIVFYAFHQFPTVFLVTNCIVVPLSSVALFGELILLVISVIPPAAHLVGVMICSLLAFMNSTIESVNAFPYAVYDGIQNNLTQTILLYIFIVATVYWLFNKTKSALFTGLAAMFIFIAMDGYEHFSRRKQQKLIVYNISRHSAIDFIDGKEYAFVGDSIFFKDNYMDNFHLKPSRTLHTIKSTSNLGDFYASNPFFQFKGHKILIIDRSYKFESTTKIPVDLIVIAHNPRLNIATIAAVFESRQYVFDGSNSTWKINQWKKECDSLHLPNYVTAEKGAYEINL